MSPQDSKNTSPWADPFRLLSLSGSLSQVVSFIRPCPGNGAWCVPLGRERPRWLMAGWSSVSGHTTEAKWSGFPVANEITRSATGTGRIRHGAFLTEISDNNKKNHQSVDVQRGTQTVSSERATPDSSACGGEQVVLSLTTRAKYLSTTRLRTVVGCIPSRWYWTCEGQTQVTNSLDAVGSSRRRLILMRAHPIRLPLRDFCSSCQCWDQFTYTTSTPCIWPPDLTHACRALALSSIVVAQVHRFCYMWNRALLHHVHVKCWACVCQTTCGATASVWAQTRIATVIKRVVRSTRSADHGDTPRIFSDMYQVSGYFVFAMTLQKSRQHFEKKDRNKLNTEIDWTFRRESPRVMVFISRNGDREGESSIRSLWVLCSVCVLFIPVSPSKNYANLIPRQVDNTFASMHVRHLSLFFFFLELQRPADLTVIMSMFCESLATFFVWWTREDKGFWKHELWTKLVFFPFVPITLALFLRL